MNTDFLIVGAGFSGSVLAERIATQLQKKVVIVEQSNGLGGLAYDCMNKYDIIVSRYGPHIFHTNDRDVWKYVNRFSNFREYKHEVLGVLDNCKVPIPFNLNSLHLIFPKRKADNLEKKLIKRYGYGKKVPILKFIEVRDESLKKLALFIYKNVYENYARKQWGKNLKSLSPEISERVPGIYISRDNRYFQDKYQGIPIKGYTQLFKNMLDNKNIQVILNTDFKEIINRIYFNYLIYTGPIDYYFNFVYGKLPYRSLRFEDKVLSQKYYQERAVVNYPNAPGFTRITEYKHFWPNQVRKTLITFEFPEKYFWGKNKPYYPVPCKESAEIFNKYQKEADKLRGKVFFLGRLAQYRYYNMDQAIRAAIDLFNNDILSLIK